MQILGSSNSAANKDVVVKIWTNGDTIFCLHSQLSRTCLIGTLAYQEIDEKIDVNRKSSGISGVWRTSIVCNR